MALPASGCMLWSTRRLPKAACFLRLNEISFLPPRPSTVRIHAFILAPFAQVTMLLSALIDSMVDEMYPLLDFYAEALTGLDDLIGLQGPERVFVTTSRKLKRRVQSLRRYAWDVRQLLQELRQNQFGVMCAAAREMMETVEVNANNMVEVSQGGYLLLLPSCKAICYFLHLDVASYAR